MGGGQLCCSFRKDLLMTSMDVVAQSTYRARKDLFIAFSPNYTTKLRGLEIEDHNLYNMFLITATFLRPCVCARVCAADGMDVTHSACVQMLPSLLCM